MATFAGLPELEYAPLLATQLRLQQMPRDMERFKQYLKTMVDDTGNDLAIPPLVIANPMAREHVTRLLERLIDQDADTLASQAAKDAWSTFCRQAELRHFSKQPTAPAANPSSSAAFGPLAATRGIVRASLVVADDAKGGWTNRAAVEYASRTTYLVTNKRFWITGLLWSSEPAQTATVEQAIREAVFRAGYQWEHGPAKTLAHMLAQEGQVMAWSGSHLPRMGQEELAYTQAALNAHLTATDMPTCLAALLGDAAADSLGMPKLGLSDRAGLALALALAHARKQ